LAGTPAGETAGDPAKKGGMRRYSPLAAAAAAAVVVPLAAAAAVPSTPPPAVPSTAGASPTATTAPPCALASPVVAYHPGQAPQPVEASGVAGCLVGTGFGGSETQVAVTADGTVVYEPAILTPGLAGTGYLDGAPGPTPSTQLSPGGLALSKDGGAQWTFDAPAGATWVPQDDALYADPATGRIFYYALSPDPVPDSGEVPPQDQLPAGYAELMTSGDDGATWSSSALPGYVESENPRFTSAPPPAGQPRPQNYPDVVYWCGNNIVKAGLDLPSYRACYRSLDGGLTWRFASILASWPVPQHPQCGTNGEYLNDMDPNYPEGSPDGALYAEVNCGGRTYLARSTDEAATWPLVTEPGGSPATVPADGELRVGSNGDLFLAYQTSASQIALRVSLDEGRSWEPAETLTPPGIGSIAQWALAERGSGELALSLLVQRGASADYDGYLVYTSDAAAPDPLLWSVRLNSLSSPMRTSAPPPARDDFIGVAIGPDGTPWASFAASCPGPVPEPAVCDGQGSNPEANEAVAGRLVLAR
jgi:hypothetical protein